MIRTVGICALLALGAFACLAQRTFPAKHMREVDYVNTVPSPDEAMVVFLRVQGGDRQTALFEVPEHGAATLVGNLAGQKRLAHSVGPGRHTFMIIGGGSTAFMDADLRPGKVYFVLVALRLERFMEFSLQPIHGAERAEFRSWMANATWVETTHESLTWAYENAANTEEQRAKYYPKWLQRPPAERLMLQPEDGQ